MKYLSPIPKQFVDQNGLPLSNGTVHVYISGDTQYANVYQDADGEELMPNPARLDSNGAWLGFVTAGVPMDYVVEDKDGKVQFEYGKVTAGSGTAIKPVLTSGTKIAECWVDGELLELFAPEGGGSISATLPIKITNNTITNNGANLTCSGNNAWAEGNSTKSTGDQSHAEGYSTEASANYTHAEGCYSKALQGSSHAEGFNTRANAASAHAEGYESVASGNHSHAEGSRCTASGKGSHAGGIETRMSANGGMSTGRYNSDDTALLVVGNGTDTDNRKDAFKVDSNGQAYITNDSGNLVKLRGAGIATFTVTQTDVNTYVYPNESDVRTAIYNYDDVILRLAPLGGGFINYVLDHQAVAVGVGTTYTWVRADGSRVITLEGSGSPVVWTWSCVTSA